MNKRRGWIIIEGNSRVNTFLRNYTWTVCAHPHIVVQQLFWKGILQTARQITLTLSVFTCGEQIWIFSMLSTHTHASCMFLSYVLKCENGMSEILKRVAREFKEESVQNQMGKILSTFANKCEVSVHEVIH